MWRQKGNLLLMYPIYTLLQSRDQYNWRFKQSTSGGINRQMRGVPRTIHKPLIDFLRNIKSCEKDDPFYPRLLFLPCITSNYVFI